MIKKKWWKCLISLYLIYICGNKAWTHKADPGQVHKALWHRAPATALTLFLPTLPCPLCSSHAHLLRAPLPWTLFPISPCLAPWYPERPSLTPEPPTHHSLLHHCTAENQLIFSFFFFFLLEQAPCPLCLIYNHIRSAYNCAWHLVDAQKHRWTNK